MKYTRFFLLVVSLLFTAGPAFAGDKVLAEALFNQGAALMKEGKTAEACAKFSASQEQEASSGTALNLARCYELLGKTASAWAEYEEAARIAKVQGRQDRVDEARARAVELEAKLAYLTLHVEERVPELVVTRDGAPIPAAAWDTKLPVDPGPTTLVARAPGYEAVTLQLTITAEFQGHQATIPALVPVPDTAASEEPAEDKADEQREAEPTPAPERRPNRTAAYVVGGAGVALLAAGAIFGLVALSEYNSAKALCGGGTTGCNDAAMQKRSSADLFANLSTVGFAAGAVGLGVGTVLFVTARPKSASVAIALRPRLSPTLMGGSLEGTF